MSVDNSTGSYEAVIAERLARILAGVQERNKSARDRLADIERNWDPVNREFGKDVEGALLDATEDQRESSASRVLLKKVRRPRVNQKYLRVIGKVFDEDEKVGLPGLDVRVTRRGGRDTDPLARSSTDKFGNFEVGIKLSDIHQAGRQAELNLEVVDDEKKILEAVSFSKRTDQGEVFELSVPVRTSDTVAPERRKEGRSVRDNVEGTLDLLDLRVQDMREAHEDLKQVAEAELGRIRSLRSALSVDLAEVVPPSREPSEPVTPSPPAPAEPATPARPGPRVELERVRGIGNKRATALRRAGINDAAELKETPTARLREILGNLDIASVKKSSTALIRVAATRKPGGSSC